ncbi:unnamed protein product [Symbiodinium microadriaticum]|nr:unnamed protein product [Symbiodinium microadriaticum]CAE7722792.1 unnamed protein product [Symbiodinium sp. KB8]
MQVEVEHGLVTCRELEAEEEETHHDQHAWEEEYQEDGHQKDGGTAEWHDFVKKEDWWDNTKQEDWWDNAKQEDWWDYGQDAKEEEGADRSAWQGWQWKKRQGDSSWPHQGWGKRVKNEEPWREEAWDERSTTAE